MYVEREGKGGGERERRERERGREGEMGRMTTRQYGSMYKEWMTKP
jgi:hypothetical protein